MIRPALHLEPPRSDWRQHAACAGMDPRLFFPEPKQGGGEADLARVHQQTERARGVCSGCVVAPDCLAWALENEEVGVWGATTYDERRAIRRRSA